MKNRTIAYLVLLFILLSSPSFAEITMFVSPDGDSGYIVEGDNAQGARSIDVAIGYDVALLANPRVEAQGGIVTGLSADTPGMLTVRVERGEADPTFELHLKFDKRGELPGVINYVAATAVDNEGKNWTAASDIRA